jgi:hypothetical protein
MTLTLALVRDMLRLAWPWGLLLLLLALVLVHWYRRQSR